MKLKQAHFKQIGLHGKCFNFSAPESYLVFLGGMLNWSTLG